MNILKEIDYFLNKLYNNHPNGLNVFEQFKHLNSIVEDHNAIGREVCEALLQESLIEPIPLSENSKQSFRITPKGMNMVNEGGYESYVLNKKYKLGAPVQLSQESMKTLEFLTRNSNKLRSFFWISISLILVALLISTGVLLIVLSE